MSCKHTIQPGSASFTVTLKATATTYTCAFCEMERLQIENVALRRVSEIASGILGMDDEDRITTVKVHFADGSSAYLQSALADAIEAAIDARNGR